MNAMGLSKIVAGCCQSGQCEEAYAGWAMMHAAGVQPDTACLNALLAALHGAKHWQRAVHVFQAARQGQVAQGLHSLLLVGHVLHSSVAVCVPASAAISCCSLGRHAELFLPCPAVPGPALPCPGLPLP